MVQPWSSRISSPASPVQDSPAQLGAAPTPTRSRGNTIGTGGKLSTFIGSLRRSASKPNLGSHKDSPVSVTHSSSQGLTASTSAHTERVSGLGLGIRDFGGRSSGSARGYGSWGGAQRRGHDDDGYVAYNGPIESPRPGTRDDPSAQASSRFSNDLLPPIHGSFGPSIAQQIQTSAAFAPSPMGWSSPIDAPAYDTDGRRRSQSLSNPNSQRATPYRESPISPPPPPPVTPLPALPSTPAFVFPPRQPATITPSNTKALGLGSQETPRPSHAAIMAQRYSQPYTRPMETSSRVGIARATGPSTTAGTVMPSSTSNPPQLTEAPLDATATLTRRPSLGTGLPTAYVHSTAAQPSNLDSAPYLPAALAFGKRSDEAQTEPDFAGFYPTAFRPNMVGWAKPATTSYPMSASQHDTAAGHTGPYPSPMKSGSHGGGAGSINSAHSSDNLAGSFMFPHPYDRSGGGAHSAQTSVTSLRTVPSAAGVHGDGGRGPGSKPRSHGGGTPSSHRHRRGENSSGHGSASSAHAPPTGWVDSAGPSSGHGGAAGSSGSGKMAGSVGSVSSEDVRQLQLSSDAAAAAATAALGSGPASKSVGAALASGRSPRSVASVPDLRVPTAVVTGASPSPSPRVIELILEPGSDEEHEPTAEAQDEAQSLPTEKARVTAASSRPDTDAVEPSTSNADTLKVESPAGPINMYEDLASHRPQAPLSPIPSSMASPNTERRDGSTPSARDLASSNSDRAAPHRSSRSNGSRSNSNLTSASSGRQSALARHQRLQAGIGERSPSPQASETASAKQRTMAQAKFHLLQQLHLEELILHSVEYAGVLEPANGCEAVFRPRPPLRSRDAETLKRLRLSSASEQGHQASPSSSGHQTHSTIAPLEAGFERHRARVPRGRGAGVAAQGSHRRTKTEGTEIDTSMPVNLDQLFGRTEEHASGTSGLRQPFFHHRMPPDPPTQSNAAGKTSGPARAAAAFVAAPAAWCATADDVSVGVPPSDGGVDSVDVPPAPKYATLPIEAGRRPAELELVYRMRSVPVGTVSDVGHGQGRSHERKRSSRLRKQPSTPELTRTGASPTPSPEMDIDFIETPDLPTVIAEGIWLDEQRAKWREQHRKSLDASPAIVAWRRRSRSRSRSRSLSRTQNELPGRPVRHVDDTAPTFYEQYRDARSARSRSAARDDGALDPRGGVLAKLHKMQEERDEEHRGRVTRQAIRDDRQFREQERKQRLRASKSSPQLRSSTIFADEAGAIPLPGSRSQRAPTGLGLNQEAELVGSSSRVESPELPTSFKGFTSRRRVASLGKDSARKAAAAAATSRQATHRRNRSASLSPQRLSDAQLHERRTRKLSRGSSSFLALFGRKSRATAEAEEPLPPKTPALTNRASVALGRGRRVHRTSASWDRAVQTEEPVHLTGEERLSTMQHDGPAPRSVVTDVPVVIATDRRSGISTGYRHGDRSPAGAFQFPPASSQSQADPDHLEAPGIAIGSRPVSGAQDDDAAAYAVVPTPTLTKAGRHATQAGYHRQQDSNDLRNMLREAHRQEGGDLMSEFANVGGAQPGSLPAPPRRRGQSISSDGHRNGQGGADGHSAAAPHPAVGQAIAPSGTMTFGTPIFPVPPTPRMIGGEQRLDDLVADRSSSAQSGSDPRSTPASRDVASPTGSGDPPRNLSRAERSASSADSYETRPESTPREVWMMDSGGREGEEDDAQFQGLFFMPPRSDDSVPRSPNMSGSGSGASTGVLGGVASASRHYGSLGSGGVALARGLRRDHSGHIDDEVEDDDDAAEEVHAIAITTTPPAVDTTRRSSVAEEDRFLHWGASRASSGISHGLPRFSSHGSPPDLHSRAPSSPVSPAQADTSPTVGNRNSGAGSGSGDGSGDGSGPPSARHSLSPDKFSASFTPMTRGGSTSSTTTMSAAAASVPLGEPGVRLGSVAGAEMLPLVIERGSSMSRSSSSAGHKTPSVRRVRQALAAAADSMPTPVPPRSSVSSETRSMLASTTAELNELSFASIHSSITAHPADSAVDETDLSEGEQGGVLRAERVPSFASQVGELGTFTDEEGSRSSSRAAEATPGPGPA